MFEDSHRPVADFSDAAPAKAHPRHGPIRSASLVPGDVEFLQNTAPKDASPALLVEAVRAASRGDALVSPGVTVRLLRQLQGGVTGEGRSEAAGLSIRETEIMRLVAVGRTNQEISDELFLSLSSVTTYLARIQARNRVGVAAWAWEHGVVTSRP